MQLVKIEKTLDSATTSCDPSSSVHDCYIYLSEKMYPYFENIPEGSLTFTDVETNNEFAFQFSKGREWRITQFRQYIDAKHITMGDTIVLNILQNNQNNIHIYIDVVYNDFFNKTDASTDLYTGYLTDSFKELFTDNSKKYLPLENGKNLEIEKIGNNYKIEDIKLNKFIIKETDGKFSILKPSSPSILETESITIEENSTNDNLIENRKLLFGKYIDGLLLASKKTSKRIKYLDEILPIKIDETDPTSIFSIDDMQILSDIKTKLAAGGEYYDWDRNGSYVGEILQTLNMYIEFLKVIPSETLSKPLLDFSDTESKNKFGSFLRLLEIKKDIKLNNVNANILFNIGQPNTGKSYNFEESQIFSGVDKKHYRYKKIPVSGGIGNEYKGLQNTDLAITYDPIKKELKFGEFLQTLMSAIVNPGVPHVIFLDDFHNQDISSLLSEYTPLFKAQQKRKVKSIEATHEIYTEGFADTDTFIDTWNKFIIDHCADIPVVPLTNRISGNSLNLVFPDNFYLLGAANFNENTLNIFADWEDRAQIIYKDPIDTFKFKGEAGIQKDFLECCAALNTQYRKILKSKNIFDTERYCFGMWKIVDSNGSLISKKEDQKKVIDFFFGMIKNSLKFNNKNSYINEFGWELLKAMQSDNWFKENIVELQSEQIDLSILHEHNIYEDEI